MSDTGKSPRPHWITVGVPLATAVLAAAVTLWTNRKATEPSTGAANGTVVVNYAATPSTSGATSSTASAPQTPTNVKREEKHRVTDGSTDFPNGSSHQPDLQVLADFRSADATAKQKQTCWEAVQAAYPTGVTLSSGIRDTIVSMKAAWEMGEAGLSRRDADAMRRATKDLRELAKKLPPGDC